MPPTPSSGPISFLDIIKEFGNITDNSNGNSTNNPDPVELGSYRASVNYKSVEYPLDKDVPTSGQISFADLRDKRLNIIVKMEGGTNSNPYTQGNARSFYNANNIEIVGNGRGKKFKNSRIHIVVTKIWGSEEGTFPTGTSNSQTNRKTCAIRTGSWTSGGVTPTSVDLRVGGDGSNQAGYIIGGGGRGGNGGASDGETDGSEAYKAGGHNGCIGTSGLGLDTPLRNLEVRSPGRIQAGCGGGGGGGGAAGEIEGDRSNERAGGGGGGGGSGIPPGEGGEFGYRNDSGHVYDTQAGDRNAQDGTDGKSNKGGNGGRGANNNEEGGGDSASGGGGGGGGGITPGDGGNGTEGAITGAEGERIDGENDANTSGEGGAGGLADAEGEGQQEGPGGAGGQHGLAIDVNGNAIASITGSDYIYGRYNLV